MCVILSTIRQPRSPCSRASRLCSRRSRSAPSTVGACCMCMWVFVRVCVYVCICVCACVYSGVCVYMLVCVGMCMNVRICAYVCMCVCVHVCMRVYVCMRVCVYVCMRVCIRGRVCMCARSRVQFEGEQDTEKYECRQCRKGGPGRTCLGSVHAHKNTTVLLCGRRRHAHP